MSRHTVCFQPTDMPFETVLTILLVGGAGYFGAFALAWLTA